MTPIYVDASPLIALGTVGELGRLTVFDGTPVVLPAVREEVTTEPAGTNLERFLDRPDVRARAPTAPLDDDRAKAILDEPEVNGDVRLVSAVLAHAAQDEPVAIVSDDRRVRTVARGLGAQVTGTIGTIVRAVEEGLEEAAAKSLVRQVDEQGLHMTGELRETADRLIEDAVE